MRIVAISTPGTLLKFWAVPATFCYFGSGLWLAGLELHLNASNWKKRKGQVCIGNMYNYTLQDDPQNVKGDPAAKSTLFVHQDNFSLSMDYFGTNRS